MASSNHTDPPQRGLLLAGVIGFAWIFTLILGLNFPVNRMQPLAIIFFVILRSFLHTGLFIIAHDAMHNSLAPGRIKLNEFIGSLCLSFYAGLDYKSCKDNHLMHHLQPESEADPDFCNSENQSPFIWYFDFLSHYLNLNQLFKLTLIMSALLVVAVGSEPHPIMTVSTIYIIPLIISSWQLFYVGTYLPHRKDETNSSPQNFIRSISLHPALSFAACYHFGYHREHHENPGVPWFRLPSMRTPCQTT